MDSITFGPDLALGIPVMDKSHRIAFEMLGSMLDLPRPQLDATYKLLASELQAHLTEEEHVMQEIQYPAAEVHRAAHGDLLSAIDQAQQFLAANDEIRARQIIKSLSNCLEAHINTMDLALAIAITRHKADEGKASGQACEKAMIGSCWL